MRILVVDDDQNILDSLSIFLKDSGHTCFCAENGKKAEELLRNELVEIALLDYSLPDTNGLELLKKIRKEKPDTVCIFITASTDIGLAVDAVKNGAYDFIEKPFDMARIKLVLDRAEKDFFQEKRIHYLEEQLKTGTEHELVGKSKQLKDILKTLDKIAKAASFTVLIEGPSGTGKELVARYLHRKSSRSSMPFVEVNCSALPAQLIESELFGHEKGSFTGAEGFKPGLFEMANGGILFLDEIGELPLEMQSKLLRALETRIVRRVGGTQNIPVDCCFITATNRDLKQQVQEKKFREDLYYRLNVVNILVPSLKERQTDIPLLVDHFIHRFNRSMAKKIQGIDMDALNMLYSYSFPGNVRELKNMIERAMLLEESKFIGMQHFECLTPQGSAEPASKKDAQLDYSDLEMPFKEYRKEALSKAETVYLKNMLQKTKGNVTAAAELAKYPRSELSRAVSKYKINPKDYK